MNHFKEDESEMSSSEERMHHIQLREGEVGRYVLLPGDPGRCPLIASHFDDAEKIAENREFTSYSGYLLGEKVGVTSTGIGGPSTAIAIEELSKIGVDTFIRVGTSSGLQPQVQVGDLATICAAVREEGTSQLYMPLAFPAVADIDVTIALREGAKKFGFSHHTGISRSTDSYYGSVAPKRMPVHDELQSRRNAWISAGVICSEMESAAVFIVSRVLKRRAGCILLIASSQVLPGLPKEELVKRRNLDPLIRTAIEALKILIERDRNESA